MDPDFRQVRPPDRPVKVETNTLPETEIPAQKEVNPAATKAAGGFAVSGASRPLTDEPKHFANLHGDGGWREKLMHAFQNHRRSWMASAVIVLVCGGLAGLLVAKLTDKPSASADKPVVKAKAVPKPTTVPSTLSGLPVDPAINQRPVTGVMVENSPMARPQAGLSEAGVVFEAIAEAGITRFLALYQDTTPQHIGPIRSARPYFEQWALGFDAGYAHVGGSPAALAAIKQWGVKDLDQFHNSGAYSRIASRPAPHNVYSGAERLRQLQIGKGYATSKFTGFARKKAAPSKQPTARSIDIAISGPAYNVHYDYNQATNSYNRVLAGAPHVDSNTNKQLSPDVVIALVMPYSLEADGYHSNYGTLGSGQAYFFQDGLVASGSWTKNSNNEQFTFTGSDGKPYKLNPGKTWVTAVKAAGNVNSKP